MKIVIAPDSYKESLSALAVATAIEQGFCEIFPTAEYVKLPVADGGEGTVEAMVAATQGEIIQVRVTGPLGEHVDGFYGRSGDGKSAFIEMAAASGLELVPPAQRNPLKTTSWGTGELIRHALDAGVKHIIIGIGGSATNDGGAGMVQALGAKLLDEQGHAIGPGGGELERLARIDISGLDKRLTACRIEVACDVTNPLTGDNGASAYIRVDWFTPDSLPVWGDGRVFLIGTEGTIELRKYINIATQETSDHLFLCTNHETRHIEAAGTVGFPFFGRLIRDCLDRTENAMPQEHVFRVMALALEAQRNARFDDFGSEA